MRYLGGKSRLAKKLVPLMQPGQYPAYYEPFVGSASVATEVGRGTNIPLHLSDVHPDLILMWKALQDGWEPPCIITEEEYRAMKHEPPSAMRGFAGFGSSYSGKFFGGYARDSGGRCYASESRKSLLKKIKSLQNANFTLCSYKDLTLEAGSLVYCDPPYAKTTGYTHDFDSKSFWEWVFDHRESCTIFVSEYTAPDFMKEVAVFEQKNTVSSVIRNATERLFRV